MFLRICIFENRMVIQNESSESWNNFETVNYIEKIYKIFK